MIRRVTADKKVDFAARDYSRPQPAPGEISDTDPRHEVLGGLDPLERQRTALRNTALSQRGRRPG